MDRPKGIVVAVALLVLAGILVFVPLGDLVDLSDVPQGVMVAGYVMGLLGLLAAWLLWAKASRLGWWLGLLIALLDGLAAAPGVLFAEDPGTRMLATTGTILRLVTVVALLWPSTRAAIGKGGAEAQ
ncbi:MAG: hypothetical protein KDH92_09895 [Chloroflexi bacterium]|nr:hypothetical protein [Chloroflexota bacterium]